MKKIAILFSGRAKVDVFDKQLAEFINKNEVDCYFSLNTDASDSVVKSIDIANIMAYNVKPFQLSKDTETEVCKYTNSHVNILYNIMSMYHHHFENIKSIKSSGKKYDCIILMRADAIIKDLIPIKTIIESQLKPNTVYIPSGNDWVGGINDQIAIGDEEVMNRYLSLYEDLISKYLPNDGIVGDGVKINMHPENLLRIHLVHGLKCNIERFPLDYILCTSRFSQHH